MTTLFNQFGRAVVMGSFTVALAAVGYASTTYLNDGPPGVGGNVSATAFNNTTSSSRSDVDWSNGTPANQIYGDSFNLPGGSSYLIDSISVFIVLNSASDSCTTNACTSEFSAETLYGGQSGTAANCGSGNCPFGPLSVSGVTFTPITVSNAGGTGSCTGYLTTSGTNCLPIYEVTFATNWLVQGGQTYGFAADGTGSTWNNLAENAGLAGWSTGNVGILGQFLNWETDSVCGSGSQSCLPFGYYTVNSSGGTAPTCNSSPNPSDICAGWDKTTNMDVILTADAVPEPGSLVLSGLGIGALGLIAFRRRKASINAAGHAVGNTAG